MKIRTISTNARRGTAQIIIHQQDPEGKTTHETRHLRRNGSVWKDKSGNTFILDGENFQVQD